MRNKILTLLNNSSTLTAGEIVTKLGEKRGSVSKCLCRMVTDKQITRSVKGHLVLYTITPGVLTAGGSAGEVQNDPKTPAATSTSSTTSSGVVGG